MENWNADERVCESKLNLKIAFLNSSLEPGRDGVGDYTRVLSEECVRWGHACCRIALNDRHVTTAQKTVIDGQSELRLPTALPWSQRVAQAQRKLDIFAPDWVSLQFVPYGFHPKGFVHGLARRLRPLMVGRRVHLMFHELWIGEAVNLSIKHRLVGAAQKRFVLNLVAALRPSAMHTSNYTYVEILRRYGVRAERLPLFGNIPVTTQNGNDWIFSVLQQAGLNITSDNRHTFWLAGFFGALHSTWPPEPLLTQLIQASQEQNRRVVLLSIGRMGEAGKALWQRMALQNAERLTFCCLGAQPAKKVSQYLNSLDFGITSNPVSLVGKSSTVASMLEHGLSVITTSKNTIAVIGRDSYDKVSVTASHEGIVQLLRKRCPHPILPVVAKKLMTELETAKAESI